MAGRVWDRFLTDQDKLHLANSKKDRTVGFGSNPAILNIDLYRGVFGDEKLPLLDGLKLWPNYCGPVGWDTIPHTRALLSVARRAGIPIVYVTGLLPDRSGVPGWSAALHAGGRKSPPDEAAQERQARRYDIIDEVAPEPGDVVLHKTGPSAFFGTPLMAQLNHLGIDTLIVTGESTSGCVRASVVDAASYRSASRSSRSVSSIATRHATPSISST